MTVMYDNQYVINYYDYNKSWDYTNPGWHEIVIHNSNMDKHLSMIKYLCENLYMDSEQFMKHCRWVKFGTESRFKFRYEKDYIMFTLYWS